MSRGSSHQLAASSLGLLLLALSSPAAMAQARIAAANHVSAVQEDLRVHSGQVVLAATLVLPAGEGPHAAAVLVSGAQEGVFRPAHPLVQRLAEDGIAVLVLGKRGVGESTGNWRRESFQQRATHVQRAIELLQVRPEIDPGRVGLIGHSQGGWIIQLAAAENPEIAFVVMLAGPGQTVFDQILTDERIHLARRGNAPEVVERRVKRLRRQLGALSTLAPVCRTLRAHYLCYVINFDPTPALEQIRTPVLALYAELDPEVPPEPNVTLVAAALERAENNDVTIHVFPRANHQFWVARTGLRDEYHELEPEHVPGFLDTVSGWIAERMLEPHQAAPPIPPPTSAAKQGESGTATSPNRRSFPLRSPRSGLRSATLEPDLGAGEFRKRVGKLREVATRPTSSYAESAAVRRQIPARHAGVLIPPHPIEGFPLHLQVRFEYNVWELIPTCSMIPSRSYPTGRSP